MAVKKLAAKKPVAKKVDAKKPVAKKVEAKKPASANKSTGEARILYTIRLEQSKVDKLVSIAKKKGMRTHADASRAAVEEFITRAERAAA